MSTPKVKLNNGSDIPIVGYGTWKSPNEEVAKAVEYALNAGYRHLDCAWYDFFVLSFILFDHR